MVKQHSKRNAPDEFILKISKEDHKIVTDILNTSFSVAFSMMTRFGAYFE